MDKPGKIVQEDTAYKKLTQSRRSFYENNQRIKSAKNRKALVDMAGEAARYRGLKNGQPDYQKKLPMKKQPGQGTRVDVPDHEKIVKNIKNWVNKTLNPKEDPSDMGGLSPEQFARLFRRGAIGPGKEFDPNGRNKGAWVCIHHAQLMAALLRQLCYPVREINVPLSQNGRFTYQEAAIQVWYNGKWHYVDAYLCSFDPKDLIRGGSYTDYVLHAAKRAVSARDFTRRQTVIIDKEQRRVGGYDGKTGKPKGGKWEALLKKPVQRSGAFFRSVLPGAHFYLVGEGGNAREITGRTTATLTRQELPGSFALEAGRPIFGSHLEPEPLEQGDESVFVGFADTDPGPKELGRKVYQLVIWTEEEGDYDIEITPWSTTAPVVVLLDDVPTRRLRGRLLACERETMIITIAVGEEATAGLPPADEDVSRLNTIDPALAERLALEGVRGIADLDVLLRVPEEEVSAIIAPERLDGLRRRVGIALESPSLSAEAVERLAQLLERSEEPDGEMAARLLMLGDEALGEETAEVLGGVGLGGEALRGRLAVIVARASRLEL